VGSALTVADVARLRGTDRVSAYRWLSRNAKPYLRKRGRLVVISKRAFALLHDPPIDDAIARRLSRLEEESEQHARRLDAHARALIGLRAL
jgi:hypothetical protein